MNSSYLLFTPGPLTTTSTVKEAMLKDSCTWEDDYKGIVQSIRSQLLAIGEAPEARYTTILMQGSGTFGVEATIGSAVPRDGKLLILSNGTYGARMEEIARAQGTAFATLAFPYHEIVNPEAVDAYLTAHRDVSHVAFVHSETTTGLLNPLEAIVQVIKKHGRTVIVDAMSSFGGVPINIGGNDIDYLVSSANKCIQGVPGFSFVICKTSELAKCKGNSRSLSLDLYDQWSTMERDQGKWRYTSPTHTVLAFQQALKEFQLEGGVEVRYRRYQNNQSVLAELMEQAGFQAYLTKDIQSPIITTFHYLASESFTFESFYRWLKKDGFVIYPGKLTDVNVFRIGTIGDIHEDDIRRLCTSVAAYARELG